MVLITQSIGTSLLLSHDQEIEQGQQTVFDSLSKPVELSGSQFAEGCTRVVIIVGAELVFDVHGSCK